MLLSNNVPHRFRFLVGEGSVKVKKKIGSFFFCFFLFTSFSFGGGGVVQVTNTPE